MSPTHADERCEVCGRRILPGEPVHEFEEPERGARRRVVCPLCPRRALARGWVRGRERRAGRRAAAA